MSSSTQSHQVAFLENRRLAGRLLTPHLAAYANQSDCLVMALPRGGVPIADEIASTLNLPLDICLVRKLGTLLEPELAMGALGSDGTVVLNEDVLHECGITQDEVDAVTRKERKELSRRERLYRQSRPPLRLAGRIVILVDDGIATGASTLAAVRVLRQARVQRLILATGVASEQALGLLTPEVDEVHCLIVAEQLGAISSWYGDFNQVTDEEVQQILAGALQREVPDDPSS